MRIREMARKTWCRELLLVCVLLLVCPEKKTHAIASQGPATHEAGISVAILEDGSYVLQSKSISGDVLRSEIEVETETGTLRSSSYPSHKQSRTPFHDELGAGQLLRVTYTGLPGNADLVCQFRMYADQSWGDIQVQVLNSTAHSVVVHSVHVVKSSGAGAVQLNGPQSEDRILSDSFSEDTPQLRLMDLGEADGGTHRAYGSQLIYNRKSGQSLFLGALSADKLLTMFHLNSTGRPDAHVQSYDVEDTGTNEAIREQSQPYGPENNVPLMQTVAPSESLSTERLMFAIGPDYHAQLEQYGHAIRILHKARVSSPTLIGWWSWTAYYYGVTEGAVLTNAEWLAQNLKPFGYRYFQVDEGYQYARGEYATADGKAFPNGMATVGQQVRSHGLTFGFWVAPFQVSDRSWVYEHHRDWLVHNLHEEPIHIGKVGGHFDDLYALDTTNPGAQEYLRQTYRTLVRDWGARFLKFDFMDSTAVEGVYYRPNTTALEALRIGLEVIRGAVGEHVIMDKDGGPMLTPVGIVDAGRISQDTGHTFGATRDVASGIAARYYMNHNFYESDPDAFTISEQIIPDRVWHGNKQPLTLDEAEASIALSAVSGGMFEIGDDLPALGASSQRLALARNADLLDMARLGHASVPVDLMTYRPEDKQPSLFLLKEDNRQWILTVFNWTEQPGTHDLELKTLGLKPDGVFHVTDILRGGSLPVESGRVAIQQPAHSVRMFKLIDTSVSAVSSDFEVHLPETAHSGAELEFHAAASRAEAPMLQCHWNFGDGVSAEGSSVSHTYTQPGKYTITIESIGLNGRLAQKTAAIAVTGYVSTVYDPTAKERFHENQ
jgi:alpha-galactosidase